MAYKEFGFSVSSEQVVRVAHDICDHIDNWVTLQVFIK